MDALTSFTSDLNHPKIAILGILLIQKANMGGGWSKVDIQYLPDLLFE